MTKDNERQSTHWVGCWKVHPQCAVARLEAIEKYFELRAAGNIYLNSDDPLPDAQRCYGNFDDVFSDGCDVGETLELQDIIKFVCNLGVMENPIKNFKSY